MLQQVCADIKPDENEKKLWKKADMVIDRYNQITGKKIQKFHNGSRSSAANKAYQTLKRGYSLDQIFAVFAVKSRQYWFYKDGYHFFTFPTLFRASNFDKYVNEEKVLEILREKEDKNATTNTK